jgi:protein-disulfide isomerase
MALKSLRPFYIGLAVLAVAGLALIVRSAGSRPKLTTETVAPLASGPRGVVLGSDSAKTEVMEFSDFECPYCGRFAVLTMPDIRQRLIATGRVRWRFVHYPITGHLKSPYAHLASACANVQGRFWEMHDLIYQSQEDWVTAGNSESLIDGYAERAGVDRARYRKCVNDREAWGRVLADRALGDSLGIGGTPTFFVNGRGLAEVPSADRLVHIVDSIAPVTPAASATPRR